MIIYQYISYHQFVCLMEWQVCHSSKISCHVSSQARAEIKCKQMSCTNCYVIWTNLICLYKSAIKSVKLQQSRWEYAPLQSTASPEQTSRQPNSECLNHRQQGTQTPTIQSASDTIFDISGIQEVWHRIFNSPNYCSKSLELPFISSSSLLCWIGCSTEYWVSHQEMIALIGALQLVLCMDIHAPSKCDSRNLQLHFAMNIPGSTVFGLYPLCSSMHRRDAKTLKVDVILTIWIDRDPDRHLMFIATLRSTGQHYHMLSNCFNAASCCFWSTATKSRGNRYSAFSIFCFNSNGSDQRSTNIAKRLVFCSHNLNTELSVVLWQWSPAGWSQHNQPSQVGVPSQFYFCIGAKSAQKLQNPNPKKGKWRTDT